MIPTHHSNKTSNMTIVVNHLEQLNEYDHTEPHRHDYYELFYFLEGGGSHFIDFIEFPIRGNSVHIVGPGQVHQMNRALDSEGYVVLFTLESMDHPKEIESFLFEHSLLASDELSPVYRFKENFKKELSEKVENIYKRCKSNSTLDRLKLVNDLQFLFICCMGKKIQDPTGLNTTYFHFRKLLKTNFKTMKKVKEYADALNISDRSLNQIVKKQTGKTASEIMYLQIIMEAKRYLRTGMNIKEVAYSLNFDDPAHFSKFFKSQTGLAPLDFQNNT